MADNMNEPQCDHDVYARYTWPGRSEEVVCMMHYFHVMYQAALQGIKLHFDWFELGEGKGYKCHIKHIGETEDMKEITLRDGCPECGDDLILAVVPYVDPATKEIVIGKVSVVEGVCKDIPHYVEFDPKELSEFIKNHSPENNVYYYEGYD